MARKLRNQGWRLSETVINNDGLIVDYIFKDSEFYGNIGVKFDDLPKQQTFTFYVTKSFDEKRKRYFIRKDIFSKRTFEYFENNINEFVQQALEQYLSWSRYQIICSGTVTDLG